jgi:prepilin-type N-terminal cleavage/methylation domain-containing protein
MRKTTAAAMRRGMSILEVVVASAILSVVSLMIGDMVLSETKQTAELMEDLGVNKETRYFFQLISSDVRSAAEILVKPEQMVGENDTGKLALVQEPIDLSRCRLTLYRKLPAGTTRKERIDYWLVDESGPPSGMACRSPAVRNAKVKTYTQAGTAKQLYPLVRTVSMVDESGVAHLTDDLLIGMVRGLAFYQLVPPAAPSGVKPVLPTVYATLLMAAFRPSPGSGYLEVYREKFTAGFTARAIVSSIPENTVPDQSDPDPAE